MENNRRSYVQSIPAKICLSILIIETILLSLMGFFYTRNFNEEIDKSLREKMQLPAVLMSLQALNFNAVTNHEAISDLIQEEVVESFIIKADGTVYYTSDPEKSGKNYRRFLSPQEYFFPYIAVEQPRNIHFKDSDGNNYIAHLAPLKLENRLLGNLYIKVSADSIEAKKQDILLLFLGGSILTILLTTLLEALFLYKLFVPRITSATSVLHQVEQGNFSAHVITPGAPDQLGNLIEQINGMIQTVSLHTGVLQKINLAGETLAEVHTHKQLFEVISGLIMGYFGVQQQQVRILAGNTGSDYKNSIIQPYLDVTDDNCITLIMPASAETDEFIEARFSCKKDSHLGTADIARLLVPLNRMLKNSIRRVRAVEMISLAEAKYRKLFTSTVDGIFRSSKEGRIEEANPALATLFGYDSPEELMAELTDLRSQAYARPEDRKKVTELIIRQGYIIDYEVNAKRKDGTVFPISMTAQAVKDINDEIVGFEGRVTNIEDRKLREMADRNREVAEAARLAQVELIKELEESRYQLQLSLDQKEMLLREVFHRTKNNMLVIISMLNLQLQGIEDEKTRSIFHDTENRIRAIALVHEKLYKTDNLSEINLGEYLGEMTRTLVGSMVLDKRIIVQLTAEPVTISIDNAVPLGLAVNEIITNAITHGFPGKRKGKIAVDLCLSADNVIFLTIKDDGVGLPQDFDPEKLTSFGMLMTRNLIVKQLEGSLSLSSENGTTATISFSEPQRLQRVQL